MAKLCLHSSVHDAARESSEVSLGVCVICRWSQPGEATAPFLPNQTSWH